jgi:hypothetical protein
MRAKKKRMHVSFLLSLASFASHFFLLSLLRFILRVLYEKYFSLHHAKLFNYVAVTYYRFVIPFALLSFVARLFGAIKLS